LNLRDLVEHWTVVGAEQDLVAAKHRDTQLGFALLLKFYAGSAGSRAAGLSCMTTRWSSSRGNWGLMPARWASTSGLAARSSGIGLRSALTWGSGSARSPPPSR